MMVAVRDEGARMSPLPPWFPCGEDDSRWWLQGVWIQIRIADAVMLWWSAIDEQVQ